MSSPEERKAYNEGVFRAANEAIGADVHELLAADPQSLVPFLCECPEPSCVAIVTLTLGEYERIRSEGRQGFALPGHEDAEIERVLERHDRYVLTEKTGKAGEVHEQGNPRDPPG